MTTHKVDISSLSTLSRKLMIAKVLEKRDKVAKRGKAEANSALGDWRSSAPIKTGRLRNSFAVSTTKSGAQLSEVDNRLKLVNILNNRGKTRGFYTRFLRKHGQSFFGSVGK